jgi:hypothetical protein
MRTVPVADLMALTARPDLPLVLPYFRDLDEDVASGRVTVREAARVAEGLAADLLPGPYPRQALGRDLAYLRYCADEHERAFLRHLRHRQYVIRYTDLQPQAVYKVGPRMVWCFPAPCVEAVFRLLGLANHARHWRRLDTRGILFRPCSPPYLPGWAGEGLDQAIDLAAQGDDPHPGGGWLEGKG